MSVQKDAPASIFDPARDPDDTHFLGVRLMGPAHCAVNFSRNDGHGTGIYPFEYLLDCAARREAGR
jgi:hypothetical protein